MAIKSGACTQVLWIIICAAGGLEPVHMRCYLGAAQGALLHNRRRRLHDLSSQLFHRGVEQHHHGRVPITDDAVALGHHHLGSAGGASKTSPFGLGHGARVHKAIEKDTHFELCTLGNWRLRVHTCIFFYFSEHHNTSLLHNKYTGTVRIHAHHL